MKVVGWACCFTVLSACEQSLTCHVDQDCPSGSFCAASLCSAECTQNEHCAFMGDGSSCSDHGRCIPPRMLLDHDGFDDPVGSGYAFVVVALAIADKGGGFDLDDRCRAPGDCGDNLLWQLGQLGNDQIRQGFFGGEALWILELTGVDNWTNDPNVTLRVYNGRDFDDPIFPANNFQIPMGESVCCQFLVATTSMANHEGPPRARNQLRGRIVRGNFETSEPGQVSTEVRFPSVPSDASDSTASRSDPFRVSLARVAASFEVSPTGLSGRFGGIWPVRSLFGQQNATVASAETELAAPLAWLLLGWFAPDIDVDADGLETVLPGETFTCADVRGETLEAIFPRDSATCLLNPTLLDGYSVAFDFRAQPASIEGIAP